MQENNNTVQGDTGATIPGQGGRMNVLSGKPTDRAQNSTLLLTHFSSYTRDALV